MNDVGLHTGTVGRNGRGTTTTDSSKHRALTLSRVNVFGCAGHVTIVVGCLLFSGRSQWSIGGSMHVCLRCERSQDRIVMRTSFCDFHENHCNTQLGARAAHLLQPLGQLSLPSSEEK